MDVAFSGVAGPLDGFPTPSMVVAQLGNDATNLYGAVQGAIKLI